MPALFARAVFSVPGWVPAFLVSLSPGCPCSAMLPWGRAVHPARLGRARFRVVPPLVLGSVSWLYPDDKMTFLFDAYNFSLPCFSLKLPLVLGEVCIMILLLCFLNFARARPWFSDVKLLAVGVLLL